MVTNENIKKLIENSGIITHSTTSQIFKDQGWFVLISPYYYDDISESVRETDLITEKQFYSSDNWRSSSVQVNVQLFVECKYIKQEIVFLFDKIDKKKALETLEKETNLRISSPYTRQGGDITDDQFRYLNESLAAKIFSTNSNKEDVIYKAMNQVLHSQIYHRAKGKKPIENEFIQHKEIFSHIIQYPVIVCDGFDKLLEVKFENNKKYTTQPIQKRFLLEANYRDEYFLIDIIDINYLQEFLENIDKEANKLISSYSFKQRN